MHSEEKVQVSCGNIFADLGYKNAEEIEEWLSKIRKTNLILNDEQWQTFQKILKHPEKEKPPKGD